MSTNTMSYRGYSARLEFDAEDHVFVGHVAGIKDSVQGLEAAFHEAVDNYLAACERLGQDPDKPFSGRVMLRLPPEVHARASAAAQVEGLSLNQWAVHALSQAATPSHGNRR